MVVQPFRMIIWSLGDLAHSATIPVIFYDQLGSGHSTHLPDKPTSFWTIDLFINELLNLLVHLNIQDNFDLIGHSWGGMLGTEVEVRRQPAGLRRLILTNSLATMQSWKASNAQLIQSFPKDVQEGISLGSGDLKRFRDAMRQFHAVHGCTVKPTPKEVIYSLDQVLGDDGDPTVSKAMFGGEIADWTIVDRLHLVRVPTLVINGRADIAQDFVCEPFFWHITKVKWVTFELSSHTPMWEERERYVKLVGDFLSQ